MNYLQLGSVSSPTTWRCANIFGNKWHN